MQNPNAALLDGAAIRGLLQEVGAEFARRGQVAEIALYGGSALALLFDNRPSTRDIDYVAVRGDTGRIAAVSDAVGAKHGLVPGWFNDSVRMFASDKPDHRFFGDFPVGGPPGLRVFVAEPHYILALKLMSMRSALETNDMRDIWLLADECGIETADQAKTWMAKFFPGEKLPPANEARLADLFDDRAAGKAYDPMRFW